MIHAHKCWMGTRSGLMLLGYWDVAGVSVTSTPMAKGEGDRRTCPSPGVSIPSTPSTVLGQRLGKALDPARQAKQRAGFFISYLSTDIKL